MVRTCKASASKQNADENVTTKPDIDLQKATMDDKLDFLCIKLTSLTADVENLKKENREKDQKIKVLETRIGELEQYSRRDDLVITGIDTLEVRLQTWLVVVLNSRIRMQVHSKLIN